MAIGLARRLGGRPRASDSRSDSTSDRARSGGRLARRRAGLVGGLAVGLTEVVLRDRACSSASGRTSCRARSGQTCRARDPRRSRGRTARTELGPRPDGAQAAIRATTSAAPIATDGRLRFMRRGYPGRAWAERIRSSRVRRGHRYAPNLSRGGQQPRPDLVVEEAVRGQQRARVDQPPAVEVGDPAAGLLDQDERRGHVPGRQLDLDHGLGGALGQQRVAPEVTEAAIPPDLAEEAGEARRPGRDLAGRGPSRTRPGHRPASVIPETWIGRGASLPAAPTAHAPPPRRAYQRWRRAGAETTAELELAVDLEGQERPEEGHPADEVVGAVDRIDVPAAARRPRPPSRTPRRRGRGRGRPPGSAPGSCRSTAWSATVTNVRSGLVITSRSRRKWPAPAGRPRRRPPGRRPGQASSSASLTRARPALQAGPLATASAISGAKRASSVRRAGHARIRSPLGIEERLGHHLEADPLRRRPRSRRGRRSRPGRPAGTRRRSSARRRSRSRRSSPGRRSRRRPGPARCPGRPSAGRRGRGSAGACAGRRPWRRPGHRGRRSPGRPLGRSSRTAKPRPAS